MSIGSEFKEFAMRGNVIDLAVGVIIGAAFGRVVSSLVADVIMPPIGKLIGGINFSQFALSLGRGADGQPVLLKYGVFIQTILDFLVVAFVIFLAIRGINKLKRPVPQTAAAAPAPSQEVVLLTEIRDALVRPAGR
jgi:large conductance mechanosensitive channel